MVKKYAYKILTLFAALQILYLVFTGGYKDHLGLSIFLVVVIIAAVYGDFIDKRKSKGMESDKKSS